MQEIYIQSPLKDREWYLLFEVDGHVPGLVMTIRHIVDHADWLL